jgi:hypothetical protein
MNTSEPKAGERIRNVSVTDDAIIVDLYDGRTRKRGVCPGQWTLSETEKEGSALDNGHYRK